MGFSQTRLALQEPRFVQTLFGSIARRYDLANRLLSGGMDVLWRRRAATLVQGWHPKRILDLATGSGDVALTLREACPEATLVGADFCVPMLREAQKKNFQTVIAADGMQLPFPAGTFDVATIAFGLRNMADYGGALRELCRVLRPGGHLLVLDFSIPPPPLLWVYRPYLHHVLPRVAGWLTGERGAYQYLGESIEKFPAGLAMTELMVESGFASAVAEPLTGGIVSIYVATIDGAGGDEEMRHGIPLR